LVLKNPSAGIKRISATPDGPPSKQAPGDDTQLNSEGESDPKETQTTFRTKEKRKDKREIKLTSLANLRRRVREMSSTGETSYLLFLSKWNVLASFPFTDLIDLVSNHSFVGCVDRKFTLLQHGTRLFLAHNAKISEHFFYQRLLEDFGNIPCIQLDPPPLIRDLARMALDGKESGT
jgi:DNA mismatch repair protein MLH1